MPEEGDNIEAGDDFGAIESVKAASDLIAPVSGEVLEVNTALEENPRLINEDPMANWIIKVSIEQPEQLDNLMSPEEYEAFCAAQH